MFFSISTFCEINFLCFFIFAKACLPLPCSVIMSHSLIRFKLISSYFYINRRYNVYYLNQLNVAKLEYLLIPTIWCICPRPLHHTIAPYHCLIVIHVFIIVLKHLHIFKIGMSSWNVNHNDLTYLSTNKHWLLLQQTYPLLLSFHYFNFPFNYY